MRMNEERLYVLSVNPQYGFADEDGNQNFIFVTSNICR